MLEAMFLCVLSFLAVNFGSLEMEQVAEVTFINYLTYVKS